MKAVTFQALHTPLAFESLPDPTAGEGQVVVKVGRCGICGSDLHMTEDAMYGCQHGDVLGHEFAGEVVALGKGAEGLKTGDLVSVIPLMSCGRCAHNASSHASSFLLPSRSNPAPRRGSGRDWWRPACIGRPVARCGNRPSMCMSAVRPLL